MQYRVRFAIWRGGVYFTEWFDTESEAHQFVRDAYRMTEIYPQHIENSDGEVV